jgi:NAD(P)H-flavin reductase
VDGGFHPARLVSRADAGGGLTLVTLEPSPAVVPSYVSPGQYIEVRADEATGYFVLAGAPGGRPWELIMRAGGGVSDVLLAAPLGKAVEVTAAIGDGFPMDAVAGRPLVLALSGTGIAAARPLVRHRLAGGDAVRTLVFLGVRTQSELPLAGDRQAWDEAGVSVVLCLSQPAGREEAAGGRFVRGYVQDVLRARAEARSLGSFAGAPVFAVGVASMVEALRALAPTLGIPGDRVHTNH